jgi:hypothetical protein
VSDVSFLSELGYVIPTGITGAMLVCFIVYVRWQESKQDKDRNEHVAKWESVIALQKDGAAKLIASHQDSIQRLIDSHQHEMDRQFKLHERNATSLEALTHHLDLIVKEREYRQFKIQDMIKGREE